MIKKQIDSIKLAIIYSFFIFIPFQKSQAMQPSQSSQPPRVYSYHNFSYNNLRNDLLNNRAVILTASNPDKRITLGNEKVAKRNRCLSINANRYRLQLHHIFFKAIRTTFPGIPYLCFQVPRRHHTLYHNDRQNTDTDYNSFSNMVNYIDLLIRSMVTISGEQNDEYSSLCVQAANLVGEAQKYWIRQRYSWLYSIESGRTLLLAQRLLAKNCFPNQIIANKSICRQNVDYLISEFQLSNYVIGQLMNISDLRPLRKALQGRVEMLSAYISSSRNVPSLSSAQVFAIANHRYKDSERFYNPISHMIDLAGEFDGESSDASSLND